MTDKDKIIQFLDYKTITKNSFYKKTGLSVGFLDSGQSLGVDKLRIILDNYPDLNIDWFLYGQGDMIKINTTLPASFSNISFVSRYAQNDYVQKYREKTFLASLPLIPFSLPHSLQNQHWMAFEVPNDVMQNDNNEGLQVADILLSYLLFDKERDKKKPIQLSGKQTYIVITPNASVEFGYATLLENTLVMQYLNPNYADNHISIENIAQIFCAQQLIRLL
ncbi:MAG: hypothetical protein J0I41_21625 [Filimonas sp.]|nr:hypothetical protein [Filimonas sp.]